MANPTPVVRLTPVGVKLKNGYQSFYAFSLFPAIALWEKQVTPLGLDNGEKIDQTTMWNEELKTYHPRALSDVTDGSMTCAYDPAVLDDIYDMIGVPQVVTCHYPDGTTESDYGYVKSFKRNALVDGTQPEATVEIVYTNVDPVNCVESAPYVVPGTGTC